MDKPPILLDRAGVIDPLSLEEALSRGAYRALMTLLGERVSPRDVIEEVKASGLRGRGGAGFPTGRKWELAREAGSGEKYVIANADEGEPGTFKDRVIMENDPHKLLEGMAIAGYAIGADHGFIYLRAEYPQVRAVLEEAISAARARGLLGRDILGSGFDFDVEIAGGAGAYICGEETALIESLEGKRGQPRLKPPYPITSGYLGKPTLVNNVETLANIPFIVSQGASAFRRYGTRESPGTRLFSVSGCVRRPGVYEMEMGVTLREVIQAAGGTVGKFKGALVGGASGTFVPAALSEIRLAFECLCVRFKVPGSGAIMVFDEGVPIVDVLYSVLRFFRHESCGKCTPCRVGTYQLVRLITAIKEGRADMGTLKSMEELADLMGETSFCPLGQSVVTPVTSALEFFRSEVEAHISAS